MKRISIISLLVLTVVGLLLAATASAQSLHLPPHEKAVLKNGLTVLLLEKHGVPMVSLTAIVKTGSSADPVGQEGLAAATAELLRKGTKNRTARQFADDLDFTGGSFQAGAGPDFTTVSAEFLTKDLAGGLNLFADALLRPTFPAEETEKLLAQGVDEIKAVKDNPQAALFSYYECYLFSGHPYGRPGSGDEISLRNIRREAIVKFYDAHYAPGNTILAVAGDFTAAEMRKKIEDIFGAWPAKTAQADALPATVPVKGKRLLLVDKPDATQTYFAIGNVGTTANEPDRVAIDVVNAAFGEQFTSMLNEALRVESGLSYGATSFFDSLKMAGPFAIFSFTKNETTAQAIDLALQTLDKLHKNGLTAEQLASTKSYIKGQFPPNIETSQQLARLIAANEFYGLDDNEVNQLEAKINAVTPEIARQIIQKHFPENNLVFTLVGKASEIGAAVRKYAEKQDARRISDPGFWPAPTAGNLGN